MKKTKDQQLSKREQVVKAGSTVLIVVAVSSVIVMFSVMSMRFLWQQKSYNSRVIKTKTEARDQLTTNLKNIDKLSQQFGELNSSETTNSKTILHALPPVYDYAALASSIDSLASLSGVSSDTNIGEDTSSSALNFATTSQPVEIPLNLNIKGSYDAIRTYIDNLERSIRPIQIQALTYTGTNSDLQILIEAKTYYQPARSLDVEITMKKNDIATIIAIIVMAGIVSYFIANAVIGSPQNDPIEIEKVTPIGQSFPKPDTRVFNDKAVDPTVEINGEGQVSNQPFDN